MIIHYNISKILWKGGFRVKKIVILLLIFGIVVAGSVIVLQQQAQAPVYDIPAPTSPIQMEVQPEPEQTEAATQAATEPPTEAPEETISSETILENDTTVLSNQSPVEEIVLVVNEIAPYSETDYPDDGQIVYATHWINVRSEPSTKGDIIGRIEEDDRVFRFETANGWSKIWHNNTIGYISNQYLGTAYVENFDLYTDVDEKVYAGHDVNIRIAPSMYAPAVGKLKQGDSVRRIGIGKNGWSQVIYKNQLFFINNTYLSTDPNFVIPLEWFQQDTTPEGTTPTEETTPPEPTETNP